MMPDFESHKSPWVIRATATELIEVAQIIGMVGRQRGNSESNVWLTRIPNGSRLWIIRERVLTAWVVADAEATDPAFAFPIPDRLVPHLVELALGSGGVDIYYNEMDGSIVGRGADRYVSIDHPNDVEFTDKDMPYFGRVHGFHSEPAVAEVSLKDLHYFADIAHDIPIGVDWEENQVYAFAEMFIGNNCITWTMDWRQHSAGRISGSIQASTTASSQVSFYPYPLARFLRTRAEHETAKIFFDSEHPEYFFMKGDSWGVRVVCDRYENARWSTALQMRLKAAGVEMEEVTSEFLPDFIRFSVGQGECFASIHPTEDQMSEYVRLTHIAGHDIPASEEILQEINALNASMYGSRVVLRDGELRIITEFPASALKDLPSHLATFKSALTRCAGITAFLPLFSDCDSGGPF